MTLMKIQGHFLFLIYLILIKKVAYVILCKITRKHREKHYNKTSRETLQQNIERNIAGKHQEKHYKKTSRETLHENIKRNITRQHQKEKLLSVKLSSTARYGLRAMSDLCAHSINSEPVCVSDIASRQNIPVNYLEQLFGKLRRNGIIESVRGAQGGYFLAREAEKITIADILSALGEPVIFGSCQTDKGCENALTCPTFNLWRKVKGSVDEILESTTLADIVDEKVMLLESINIDPQRKEVRERAMKLTEE